MSVETRTPATLLRRAQLLLGDLAFHIGAGQLEFADLDAGVSALEDLFALLHYMRLRNDMTPIVRIAETE
ncbi:hypothetical protein HUO13_06290 [Saccharopolyspora erythraea]|uniref:hypothetical protein n=1 Tax=Saccharopolyspora erythraea TaxID=1836 RepID=UPI001BA6B817|nr:hypothetical protein [Saccharopolyspora erythraea]QUH00482.1 hypothetical protein HUO13_06290 [Saccharopolyspora erythraea]